MATITDRYVLELDTQGATNNVLSLQNAVKGFVGFLAVDTVTNFGSALLNAADTMQTYENRLMAAGIAQQDLNNVLSTLQGVANANRVELGATVDLYSKLQQNASNLGLSQEEVVKSLNNFQVALKAAGTDAAAADAAIYQFGQAMASGRLQGDEFRSIMEAMGTSIAAMAQDAGLSVQQIRDMASAGELTAEVFLDMLNNSTSLQERFAAMQPTVSELNVALGDAFTAAAAKIAESTGLAEAYGNTVKGLTRDLQQLAGTAPPIVNEDNATILEKTKDGTYSVAQAVDELNARISDTYKGIIPGQFLFRREEREELVALREELERFAEEQKQAAEVAKAQAEAQRLETEARNAALGPLKEVLDRTKEYNGEIDKELNTKKELTEAQAQIQSDLEALNAALGTEAENHANVAEAIAATQKEYDAINALIKEMADENITRLNNALSENKTAVEAATVSAQDLQTNLATTIERVNTQTDSLNALTESTTQQATVFTQLNDAMATYLQNSADFVTFKDAFIAKQTELNELFNVFQTELAETVEAYTNLQNSQTLIQEANTNLGISYGELTLRIQENGTAIQNSISTIQQKNSVLQNLIPILGQLNSAMNNYSTGLRTQLSAVQSSISANSQLANSYNSVISQANAAAAAIGKAQSAQSSFNFAQPKTTATTFQNSSNPFANLNKFFNNTLNKFAGGFANGGVIPRGKFGLVGENGPEFISGPATITPIAGSTTVQQVTYNINAVDVNSFKSLVAKDPAFIHAVASRGARSIPGRR